MDNYPNQQPNLNLPPMGGEAGPNATNHELEPSNHPEVIATPESSVSQAPQAPPSLLPVLPSDNPITQTAGTSTTQTTDIPVPMISDESRDLIAKEWVIRAKRIVEQTRDDPYQQSREFNKLKAEYVKRRYNMTIKVNNE